MKLRRALNELLAAFKRHTAGLLSVTRILELASWSHAQRSEADDKRQPLHFEVGVEYACYRPEAKVKFESVIDLCATSIAVARQRNVTRLLVDTTRLTGFAVPGAFERFEFARRCAAAHGTMKVVFVARQEMIDEDYFGLTVASNRGFYTAIFASESEAVSWLLDPKT